MSVACNLFWFYSVGRRSCLQILKPKQLLTNNCKANILIDLQLFVEAPFEKIFVLIAASEVCYNTKTASYIIPSSEK